MADQSKPAGVSARRKTPAIVPGRPEKPTMSPPASGSAAGAKGRPATGKRSDPDWSRYTILLRKMTHKQAVRRLLDLETVQDLSELVDELLTKWLGQQ